MNYMKYILAVVAVSLVSGLIFTSCSDNIPDDETGNVSDGSLTISVSATDFEWGQVPYGYSRASDPMIPEMENSLKTLAILQFDSEGNLRRELGTADKPFKYINLVNETTPNGVLTYDITLASNEFYHGVNCAICIMANVPEEEVMKVVFTDQVNKVNTNLKTFRTEKITIPYVTDPSADDSYGLQIGHVKRIYMFGEYTGDVTSETQQLNIGLGRMISRLEFEIKSDMNVNEGYGLYLGIKNLEKEVYFYHGETSPNNLFTEATPFNILAKGVSGETVDLSKGVKIFFYVAPRIANNPEDATSLNFWYTNTEPDSTNTPDYTLPLGNNMPGSEVGDYSLNRNTYYKFYVRLTASGNNSN